MSDNKPRFAFNDLEKWVGRDLITSNQVANIRTYVEKNGTILAPANAPLEQKKGLNFITIAYYFGGFMILLAYTVFMGEQWDSFSDPEQIAIAFGSVSSLWGMGYFLRRKQFTMASDLLIFAGTGISPLLIYTIQNYFGLWGREDLLYDDFYRVIAESWVMLELISITIALIVIWVTRIPLITFLIAFLSWYLSMDAVRLITKRIDFWDWSDPEQIVAILMGFGMLLVGYFLQRKLDRDYSTWFYIFGHIIIFCPLSILTLDHEGALGLFFIAIYLCFVGISIWLQRKVFLVFGAIGSYAYLGYLAYDVFENSLGFTFTLAIIGLMIIFSAVGYQQYFRLWAEKQLAQ